MAQSRIRLAPSRFNNLLLSILVRKNREQNLTIENASSLPLTNNTHSGKTEVEYIKVKVGEKLFYISQVIKDAATQDNQLDLAFIGDVIQQARSQIKDPRYSLLFPMRQCRGFAKLSPGLFGEWVQRAHIVLVQAQINTAETLAKVEVHDSQSWSYTYPDKLKDLASTLHLEYNCKNDYHAYAKQQDYVLCGYYVLAYIMRILEGKPCDDVSLSLQRPFLDEEVEITPDTVISVIKNIIARNLNNATPVILGVPLSWQQELSTIDDRKPLASP